MWCKGCQHQVDPDLAKMAGRYGGETTVLDWRERLVCSRGGSRQADMVARVKCARGPLLPPLPTPVARECGEAAPSSSARLDGQTGIELRLCPASLIQLFLRDNRAAEVGAAEVGAAEVGAAEVGAAEVGAAEVGAARWRR